MRYFNLQAKDRQMDKIENNNKARRTKKLPEKLNLVADAPNLSLNHVQVHVHLTYLVPVPTDAPKDANRLEPKRYIYYQPIAI